MKKVFIVMLLSVFSSLLIGTSCNKSGKVEPEVADVESKFEVYKLTGDYHNENLEYIYKSIENEINSRGLMRRSDNKSLQEFINNEFISKQVSDFAKKSEILDFQQYDTETYETCFKMISNYYPVDRSNSKSGNNFKTDFEKLNDYQKKYISLILNNDSNSIESFQNRVEEIVIEMESDENLRIEDRDIVYLAAAVAYSSYEYWTKNTSKWENLLTTTNQKKYGSNSKFKWDDMWRSDVEGAVGGGIGGAIGGGSVSLGVLTVPGWVVGAVGGAVGTSAGNAVGQWLF